MAIRHTEMNCIDNFEMIYGRTPDGVSFCPYRVCPLGAHVDHQNGLINGLALDKGIHIAYGAKQNGIIELASLNFSKRAQFHVREVPKQKEGDWADYLRGAAKILADKYPVKRGICGVIEGSLPIGGLSSSAAVTLSFLWALCKVNDLILDPFEMIAIAKAAENDYVGVSSGKLDQSCEILCKEKHLLYLDTADDSYELIQEKADMKPYKIGIFFSGLERSLAGSKYNMRVDECKSAAYALMAFSGMEYGKYKDARLRDVPFDTYEEYKSALPENWRKRAQHYYEEVARASAGAEAWRRGDIEEYGRLMTLSGDSSINNYESGSEELKALHEIVNKQRGVYGGRFSGAGFKGCYMALVDPEYEEEIAETVERAYLNRFIELRGRFSVHMCDSADGIHWRE